MDIKGDHVNVHNFEAIANHFMEWSSRNMADRGFGTDPCQYRAPKVVLFRDARGVVKESTCRLVFNMACSAFQFFFCWQNYHWQSETQELRTIKLYNPNLEDAGGSELGRQLLSDSPLLDAVATIDAYSDMLLSRTIPIP